MVHTNKELQVRSTDLNAVTEAAKAAPPLTVGGLTLWGVGLADWVLMLTAIYTLLQIFFLIRDKLGQRHRSKDGSK